MPWERHNGRKIMVWFSTALLFLPQHLPTRWGYGIQIEETRLQVLNCIPVMGQDPCMALAWSCFILVVYQCRKEWVCVWATPQLLTTILSFNKVSLIDNDCLSLILCLQFSFLLRDDLTWTSGHLNNSIFFFFLLWCSSPLEIFLFYLDSTLLVPFHPTAHVSLQYSWLWRLRNSIR